MKRLAPSHRALLVILVAATALSACDRDQPGSNTGTGTGSGDNGGSGSGTSGTGTAQYSVGGGITGLTADGLSLASGSNTVSVATGATSFTLPNLLAAGASYAVTVHTQPLDLSCSVVNGSGKISQASVTDVQVSCATSTFTIGGTITGLNADGLVLANGTDTLAVSAGSSAFRLPTEVAVGASYAVTVQTQPTGLNCQVINGSSVMPDAAVTNVVVACGQWAWESGSDQTGQAGSYGSQDVADPDNVPGARTASAAWRGASGTLWLFGGSAAGGDLADLWQYTPGAGWIWVAGSSSADGKGSYGSPGVDTSGHYPGARDSASTWMDGSGNLWLFGGQGYDANGTQGSLDDLWEYNVGDHDWIWMAGEDTAAAAGATPPTNEPGPRTGAATWVDGSGNLWLFGGMGTQGLTNDLWEYSASGGWTLVLAGSATPNAVGTYGALGKAADTNLPGSRTQAVSWVDGAGNLWLFGGAGYGSIGNTGLLNDLWEFTRGNGEWTWMGGWNTPNATGVYGTQSTTATPLPGARAEAAGVADGAGNLWLFGGTGYDAAGNKGALNDFWEYEVGSNQWIWMGGSQSTGAAGVYGSAPGSATPGDGPGERAGAVAWIDGSGDFWLFGGQGWASAKTTGLLNDLWEFAP